MRIVMNEQCYQFKYMASLYETVSPWPLTFKDQKKSYPERLKEAQQERVYKMLFKQEQV
jgi:hypothetical protein